MILVRAEVEFIDIRNNNQLRKVGEVFEVSYARLLELKKNGVKVSVRRVDYLGKKKKSGPKVIFFQKLLYVIGGIETWGLTLAKLYEDRDITFIFSEADDIQMMEFAKFCNVIVDDGVSHYKCDVLISANYDGGAIILDRVEAKKRYQTIHSDFQAIKKCYGWHNFDLKIDDRFDKVIAASETAQRGLKNEFGYDSIVIQNPLVPLDEKPLILLTLSRASEEKGFWRMVSMAKRLEGAGKPFIWLVCSTLCVAPAELQKAIKSIPEMIEVEPQFYTKQLLHVADYCVQLSDTEAYCYSVHEALATGVPVIATKFDQAKKIIKDGKNGYLLDFDLSNLNVNKIFSEIPKGFTYTEKPSPLWEEVMNGTL